MNAWVFLWHDFRVTTQLKLTEETIRAAQKLEVASSYFWTSDQSCLAKSLVFLVIIKQHMFSGHLRLIGEMSTSTLT